MYVYTLLKSSYQVLKGSLEIMRLTEVKLIESKERIRVSGMITWVNAKRGSVPRKIIPYGTANSFIGDYGTGANEVELYFEYPREYADFVSDSADAFAVAMLLPSMLAGDPLEIVPPISPRLADNLVGIRDIFSTWIPEFQRLPIVVEAKSYQDVNFARTGRTASLFSGGIDSFFTALRRLRVEPLPSPLTHLLNMQGIEQPFHKLENVADSNKRILHIAEELGVKCIIGGTNLRTIFPLHWERYFFGSGLSATALSLQKGFDYVCLPSDFTYNHQVPRGSTPLTDERFSTESLRIVHDGAETTRAKKTANILEWETNLVLDSLRVCYLNAGGNYNCGHCYKCVRTAVALKAVGLWEKADTFRDKSTKHWPGVIWDDHPVLVLENLELARERNAEPAIIRMLEHSYRKMMRYNAVAEYMNNSFLSSMLPVLRKLYSLLGGKFRSH